MKYYEMDNESRAKVRAMIHAIIGTKEDSVKGIEDLSERITRRSQYDKQFDKLVKVYDKNGEKALAMHYMDCGSIKKGTTPNGNNWSLEMNNGYTARSRYCGTLYINGECIYTSGTVAKAFEYILNN